MKGPKKSVYQLHNYLCTTIYIPISTHMLRYVFISSTKYVLEAPIV